MMHGLVLAGGLGSRLAASGVAVPKALIELDGEPQLVRMIRACRRAGVASVTAAVREDLVPMAAAICGALDVHIAAVRTPSSLHTLVEALRVVPDGDVLCTLVDTVMPAADWDAMHAAGRDALRRADAVVAVTPFVADDTPLWVDVSADGVARGFGIRGTRDLVTGGVYWLAPGARRFAADAVERGISRLRGFLAALVEDGSTVRTVEVAKIVDVDTNADLHEATALIGAAR